jgi:RimJ/RimL family protein N-acetyltransferase
MINRCKPYRVYLRALELDDCELIHSWRSDPVYNAGVIPTRRYSSLATEKRWIENAIRDHESLKISRLAVVVRESNEMIGVVSLKSIDFVTRQAAEGIFIGSCRGNGYSIEARILNLEVAFMDLGLERVTSRILVENNASISSVIKVGFVSEGIMRHAAFKNGKHKDVAVFSMLRNEYIDMYGN